jgi:DNA-binding beta-propeller fold protein YncE
VDLRSAGDGTVTPISLATGTAGTPITVGSQHGAIAITPDGQTAYVTNKAGGTMTPVLVSTRSVGAAVNINNVPTAIAITPDGKTAYIANQDVNSGMVTRSTLPVSNNDRLSMLAAIRKR